MDMLTVKEVADLKSCSERYVQKMLTSGKIIAQETLNQNNRKMYLVPVAALDEQLQIRYYNQRKQSVHPKAQTLCKTTESKPLDHYSEDERKEIAFWIDIIEKWQEHRNNPKVVKKTDVDEYYVSALKLENPDLNISVDTLYRRWNAYKNNDIDGLIDKRGKWKKGQSSINPMLWDMFLSFYLDEAQHPISKCYSYTEMWAKEDYPELLAEIPTYTTFYRRVQSDIAESVKVYGREGEKAYKDRCAPYIKRTYDDMSSNEWWIADNHTFDVQTKGENGKLHRLYLTAFMDARSGIFTGFHVTENPCSQATLIALRKGILKYGIPENIYVDNGREFLTFDIGGLGHRKKRLKSGSERFEPPPVFRRLGINMTNAIVRNAKAKIIERRFLDVKNGISRLFETFTGGNVVERPEKLKGVIKKGDIVLDASFIDNIEQIIDYYLNYEEYNGAVASDKGKLKMEVYNQYLTSKRVASAEDLNLMLMRSSRSQKITRRGVHLDICGQRMDYWNDDFITQMMGKEVYFRYDPDDLSEVRIYDLEDRYIMTVPVDNEAVLKYGASKDEVKSAQQKVHRAEKIVKEAVNARQIPIFGRKTALELVIAQARENKEARLIAPAQPKILDLQRNTEEPLLRAVGSEANFDVMNRNAMKKQGGLGNE